MDPSTPFNLDQAIANWRKELARHHGPDPIDVRELEAHLREGYAELRQTKLTDEEAFLIAQRRVGPLPAVAGEFAKTTPPPFWRTRVFGATFALIFGAFVVFDLSATPFYQATATLIGPLSDPAHPSNADEYGPEAFNIRIRLLETREAAQDVASRMSSEERTAFLAPFHNQADSQQNSSVSDELVNRLLTSRTVYPGRLAYSLLIAVEHPDRQIAATVANDYAAAFLSVLERRKPDTADHYQTERALADTAIQVAPKTKLLLVGGFITALLSASTVALLARVLFYLRHPRPPTAMVS